MKAVSLTILRATVPALALAVGLAVGTLAASAASANGGHTTYAPDVGRGYVRQTDEVTAFGLADRQRTVLTAPRTGRGYLRQADEVAAFGLSDERPIVVEAPRVVRGGALPSIYYYGLAAGR